MSDYYRENKGGRHFIDLVLVKDYAASLQRMLRPFLPLRTVPRITLYRSYQLRKHPIASRHFFMDSVKPLDFASGPLVWIDCEMTGLNSKTDRILEIAVCAVFLFINEVLSVFRKHRFSSLMVTSSWSIPGSNISSTLRRKF